MLYMSWKKKPWSSLSPYLGFSVKISADPCTFVAPKSVPWAAACLEPQILIFRSYQTFLLTCPTGSSGSYSAFLELKSFCPSQILLHCFPSPRCHYVTISKLPFYVLGIFDFPTLSTWPSHIVGIQLKSFVDAFNKYECPLCARYCSLGWLHCGE